MLAFILFVIFHSTFPLRCRFSKMAKNSNYKLTYFPIRGIAEPIRLIFAYAGVNYEDIRIPFEEWPTKKSTTPFRTMPILEVDGEVLGQSNAIARLLAKRFNLAGGDDVEQAKVNALTDYVSGKVLVLDIVKLNFCCFKRSLE